MALRITTAATITPITTADAKLHLRVDASDEDAYIDALVIAAKEAAEQRTNRSIMAQTFTLTLDEFPTAIRLDFAPILSVTSVEYKDPDTGEYTTLSSSSYTADIQSEPGWIVPAYDYSWTTIRQDINAVRVIYRAGYSASETAGTAQAAVPKSLRQWMLLAVGDMYSRRNASAERPAVEQNFADRLLDRYKVYG